MTREDAEAESVLDSLTHTYERWPCYCGAVIALGLPVIYNYCRCKCGRSWRRYAPTSMKWAFWQMIDAKGRKRGRIFYFHY